MTGGRPRRDARISARRERGPQRGDPPAAETRWTGTGGAELEELHVAAVSSGRSARIGLRTLIAGLALVGLLAVGLGAFGGRPQASPPTGSGAVAAGSGAAQASAPRTPYAEPRVTPFAPCGVENARIPQVVLSVDGREHLGDIELVSVEAGQPTPDVEEPAGPTEPVQVPMDASTTIRIAGARCALAWVIDVGATTTLDVLANGAMDPARAAQNQFSLPLATYPGLDSLLRAQLLFPGFTIRATWAVQVDRAAHPTAEVHWLDQDTRTEADIRAVAEGCSVLIQYDSGWREPDHECSAELPTLDPEPVNRTAAFRFYLGEWMVSLGGITCGRGVDATFIPDDGGCPWTFDSGDTVIAVEFPATFAKGPWTLAIDGCGYNNGAVLGQLCGTWYAGVKLR